LPAGEPWTTFAGIPGSWRSWRRPPLSRPNLPTRTTGPYRVPDVDHLAERLDAVLAVVYLLFNEGYLTSTGDSAQRRDLTEDAEWLATLLARLMPTEPEALGLLALIRLHRARAGTRFDDAGRLVLIADEDRRRWDRAAIAEAAGLVVRASRLRRPGPYQLQAAIVACHAEAATWEATDWPQILLLYDALYARLPTPVVGLHRAIAVRQVVGSTTALAELDALLDRWRAITCSTPPARSCCAIWAAPPRPGSPMSARSDSPETRPNGLCSKNASFEGVEGVGSPFLPRPCATA
jgi:hypothetical protein